MFTMEICEAGSASHQEISQFASLIYKRRHDVPLENFPDIFCCARTNQQIIGCFGITLAEKRNPLLFETYLTDAVLVSVSEKYGARNELGELGTRAVDEEYAQSCGVSSAVISAALTAELVVYAHQRGLRYLVFTTNRSIRIVAKLLGAPLTNFGSPDLSQKDPSFVKKWEHFFSVPQFCFGANVEMALSGALAFREKWAPPQ